MPIVRIDDKLVYFAHVPKCAGTAVEKYLADRFGPLAFCDRAFAGIPVDKRWHASSPQHVPFYALNRLFPPGFFDATFAIIRHPVDRVASAYLFQREIQGQVAAGQSFGDWLDEVARLRHSDIFAYDNHTRPIADFVPGDATLFRLEDGLAPVVAWLDQLAGAADGARQIGTHNVLGTLLQERGKPEAAAFRVSPADRAKIRDLYAIDFERFGYDPDAPTRY